MARMGNRAFLTLVEGTSIFALVKKLDLEYEFCPDKTLAKSKTLTEGEKIMWFRQFIRVLALLMFRKTKTIQHLNNILSFVPSGTNVVHFPPIRSRNWVLP